MFNRCEWLNEPATWVLEDNVLRVTTDASTDFWRGTHYGFVRDSGHCFGARTEGDFTAQVRIRGGFESLYDQAGLMVRIDEANWVKAGVEFTDGALLLSSVLTVGQSDWAVGSSLATAGEFWLRATVSKGVLKLQFSTDGKTWPLLRLAPFPVAQSWLVGPMCCTPERAGLVVDFADFEVGPPREKDLHDLS